MTATAKRVLVVDDDRETLSLLELALRRKGYIVLIAETFDEISNHVKRVYAKNEPIDIMVLDLMMPGQSGFDILRSLSGVLVPMPPVIMLTAVTGLSQQLEARDLGVRKYITKPTTPNTLIAAIEDILKDAKPRIKGETPKFPPKRFTNQSRS